MEAATKPAAEERASSCIPRVITRPARALSPDWSAMQTLWLLRRASAQSASRLQLSSYCLAANRRSRTWNFTGGAKTCQRRDFGALRARSSIGPKAAAGYRDLSYFTSKMSSKQPGMRAKNWRIFLPFLPVFATATLRSIFEALDDYRCVSLKPAATVAVRQDPTPNTPRQLLGPCSLVTRTMEAGREPFSDC